MILPSSISKSCQPKRDNMFGGNVGVEEITFLMEGSRTSYSATLSPWTSPNSFGQPGALSGRVSVSAESSANVVWSLTPPKPSTSTCRKVRRDELTRQASRGLRNQDDSIAPLTTFDGASPISVRRNCWVNGVVRRVVLMEESALLQVAVSF